MSNICIIGAGSVGASIAFALISKNIGSSITLIDINNDKMVGEVMDLSHGLFFSETTHIKSGTLKDAKSADIIIITAGVSQKPGDTRLDLVNTNIAIIKNIFSGIGKIKKTSIVIMVTNPVDILTYVAQRICNLPSTQVFGTGTYLDTSRLRYFLGEYFGVNPKSVHAYIIGEHGDSEIPAYSTANIAGLPLKKHKMYNKKMLLEISSKTKEAAYDIIKRKGSTYYAIALAVSDIIEALIYNQNIVMPVSVKVSEFFMRTYELPDICLGLPTIINKKGTGDIINIYLNKTESRKLKKSATILRSILDKVGY